ncbi:hypothetical protein SYNPS1DRAFT_28881 [Syncephalis pseudoplumigaleata]|uniref:Uncharacterized protein n=1 Tax=Syncephalis pseudoplumigaleata TaxID=1712513 RepID=A0A4P9YZ45_9FUNG|nr:hypothetical protein SYNPS1DRAFT_28881 [Syncephalis pseudoplumigaleata]|eukprot:RKP25386.1 hypothetical protein SYNPS1DRAFT_28881 [Syncephalis pseudoplumigaleata]
MVGDNERGRRVGLLAIGMRVLGVDVRHGGRDVRVVGVRGIGNPSVDMGRQLLAVIRLGVPEPRLHLRADTRANPVDRLVDMRRDILMVAGPHMAVELRLHVLVVGLGGGGHRGQQVVAVGDGGIGVDVLADGLQALLPHFAGTLELRLDGRLVERHDGGRDLGLPHLDDVRLHGGLVDLRGVFDGRLDVLLADALNLGSKSALVPCLELGESRDARHRRADGRQLCVVGVRVELVDGRADGRAVEGQEHEGEEEAAEGEEAEAATAAGGAFALGRKRERREREEEEAERKKKEEAERKKKEEAERKAKEEEEERQAKLEAERKTKEKKKKEEAAKKDRAAKKAKQAKGSSAKSDKKSDAAAKKPKPATAKGGEQQEQKPTDKVDVEQLKDLKKQLESLADIVDKKKAAGDGADSVGDNLDALLGEDELNMENILQKAMDEAIAEQRTESYKSLKQRQKDAEAAGEEFDYEKEKAKTDAELAEAQKVLGGIFSEQLLGDLGADKEKTDTKPAAEEEEAVKEEEKPKKAATSAKSKSSASSSKSKSKSKKTTAKKAKAGTAA